MRYENTDTHHMVDDELSPQEEAMNAFHGCFGLVCYALDPDGMTMRYSMRNEGLANLWKSSAQKIISLYFLPLKAELDIKWFNGVAVHISLNIIYTPF
jgi:hypothetical protein